LDDDAADHRAHPPHAEIAECRAQRANERLDEPGTIAALQRELAVMDDHRGHGLIMSPGGGGSGTRPSCFSTRAAATRPLCTAPSIVAGRPVSVQSPAR